MPVEILVSHLSATCAERWGTLLFGWGWETQGPSGSLGMTDSFRGRASGLHGILSGWKPLDYGSLDFARDDRFFSRPCERLHGILSGWRPLCSSLNGTAEAVPFPLEIA